MSPVKAPSPPLRQRFGSLPVSDWNRTFTLGAWRLHAVSVPDWPHHFPAEKDLSRVFDLRERAFLRQTRFDKRRLEWGAGRLAAKQALQQLHLGPKAPRLALRDIIIRNCNSHPHKGRPLANVEGNLSISHAGTWAVAVASHFPVGVDIEPIRSFCGSVQEMAFTFGERNRLSEIRRKSERDSAATLFWSFKEALLKSYGRSIFGFFTDVELHAPTTDSGSLSWSLSSRLKSELGTNVSTPLVAATDTFHGSVIVIVGQPAEA